MTSHAATRAILLAAIVLAASGFSCRNPGAGPQSSAIPIAPAFETAALPDDPDDPAVWMNPVDPARSLILGTIKVAAPTGGIVVYGVDGRIRQTIQGVDRPNNIDVEYGLELGGQRIDIAIATERLARRLRAFRIDGEAGKLIDLGGIPILEGQDGEAGAPMGVSLYRRHADGAIYAIVAPKTGPRSEYLWQYRLADDGRGALKATLVRRFGRFSGSTISIANEIEAVAVDDELGYVYYADEADGIHKWHADPDRPDAAHELAVFGRSGFRGDREGIAIYRRPDGTGYIVCTDQLEGDSEYHVFAREGASGNPHDHSREIAVFRGGADSTDGIEIAASPLGGALRHGALVAMNSRGRNFLVFRWEDVAAVLQPAAQTRLGTTRAR